MTPPLATASCWKRIGLQPHHGIALPLSALHSELSCGIGEFYDLCPLIDWCQELQLDVIQLLPLNNSENDPSPYNASSSCALNPLYLSLHQLPHLASHPDLLEKLVAFRRLPRPARIDFPSVHAFKMSFLHTYFDRIGQTLFESSDLQRFLSENPGVRTYGLYHALKDLLAGSSWTTWPAELKNPTAQETAHLLEEHGPQIRFHIVLQYFCYCQLKAVKAYANQKGVFLMGDIPILLSRESVDLWESPELFDLNWEAGAPPDIYNLEGQCWGFPLYRWDVMRKNQFAWWKRRLAYASHFYDIYRLDHVIGFFRIWAVPPGKKSKEGGYLPKDETEWERQGREILETLVTASPMLPIAEDLGIVPEMVRPVLHEMGICGTKVMRWERNWDTDQLYTPIEEYPPFSLTTLSTHDSETLELWWKLYPEEAGVFAEGKQWEYTPLLTPLQREEILWASHHTASLFHINLLQEYLALFPELVSGSPEEERINIPGKFLSTNWTYRFRPSIEEILAHKGLAHAMFKIVHS